MKRCPTAIALLLCTFKSTFTDRSDYGRVFSDNSESFSMVIL